MKKTWGMLLAGLLVLLFTTSAVAAEEKKPRVLEKSKTITAKATVEAVDLDKRTITLKRPTGEVETFTVDEKIRNLPQVEVGDQVVVTYHVAVAFRMAQPGDAGASDAVVQTRAEEGEKPGAVSVRQTTITATIEAIDRKARTVTLKGPEGNTVKMEVKNPDIIKKRKVGEKVLVTFTSALAISVEKVKK